MNIRKVLAGSMAAIAAGATVAFGAFAQASNLGAFVDTSGTTPVPPWIIVGAGQGDPAYAKDVVGAADLAAAMAGYVTTTQAVGGVSDVSVSGGVSLSTANTKIFGADPINAAKDTLTSEDLPTILASETFEDDDGNSYEYDQYIVVGGSTIALSNSDDDDVLGEDPAPLIDIGTNASAPAYTLRVVFNDDLNFSGSDVDGNDIELFGGTYTVSADSDTDILVLFGGANKQTLSEGETVTIEVAGVSYSVSLIGVSDSSTAVVKVNDVSRTITQGQSRKISGLEVFVDEVFYLGKEAQVSSVQLTFGAQQITINDDDEVSVGSGADEEDIDNTHVTFTQGSEGTSVLEIAVAAPDSDGDFASVDRPFTDPVFGSFKLAYGGGAPAVETFEPFAFATSGDDTATVQFKNDKGVTKTIDFAYDDSSTSTTNVLALADGDDEEIHVVEGDKTIEEDHYVVINQDDFSHLLLVKEVDVDDDDAGEQEEGTLTLEDVFSGTDYEIDMDEQGVNSNYFNGTKVIDGKTYKFWADQSTSPKTMAVVWDTGSSTAGANPSTGTRKSVFPTLVAAQDAEVAFLDNVSVGAGEEGSAYEILGFAVTLDNETYNEITGTSINYTYEETTGELTIEGVTEPSVLILEEEGEDITGTDVQNAVIVQASDNSDGITINTGDSSLIFTDDLAAAASWLSTSDNDIEVKADRYGAYATKDEDDQGEATVSYPDTQVINAVAFGVNPVFTEAGEAGTVQVASKITTPVAKLANEVTGASITRDVILVGGPCANSLVATLMNVATTYPECAADFADLNDGMIKNYADAFGSGQKALVIAGVTGDDTRALAARVISQGTADYSA